MAKLERRLPKRATNSYFLSFASNNTSQGGEDGILKELFRLIYVGVASSSQPYCVEIGAWDGKHLSNTYSLLNDHNWRGLLVEADASRHVTLCNLYKGRRDVICLNHLVEIMGERSLESILSSRYVPLEFEFLSIDIDGADYHLWHSLSRSHFKPIVVCVEFNPTITNDVYYVQPPSVDVNHGSSLLALIELGKEMGYSVVVTTLYNAIFLRSDFMHKLPPIDNDINTLHIPQMSTSMFQTYDGELKFVGLKKLLWNKLSFNVNKMQALATKDQKFPFRPNDPDISGLKGSAVVLGQAMSRFDERFAEHVGDVERALEELTRLLLLPHLKGLVFHDMNRIAFQILSNDQMSSNTAQLITWKLALILFKHADNTLTTDIVEAEKYNHLTTLLLDKLSLLKPVREIVEISLPRASEAFQMKVKLLLQQARILRLQERYLEAWSVANNAIKVLTTEISELGAADYEDVLRIAQKESKKNSHLLTQV